MKFPYKMPSNSHCEDEDWLEETINLVLKQIFQITGRCAGVSHLWKKRTGATIMGIAKQLYAVGKAIKEQD